VSPLPTRLQERGRTRNKALERTRLLRIREAVSLERGPSTASPVRHVIDRLPDGAENAFLKPGKEAERKRNPKLQDMTLVVRGYEAASFRDVWSMLARVALSDDAGFAGLATLIYRCAFHLDHEVEDRRLRYRPGPPAAAFIGDLGGRLGALLPDGNAWALLHFLDMLGWNEDVKYHFEEGRATFTGKYDNFMTGRLTTLLTCIRVPYEVSRFARHAAENAKSPDRTDFGHIIDVMNQFSVARGTCVPNDDQLLAWLQPHLTE